MAALLVPPAPIAEAAWTPPRALAGGVTGDPFFGNGTSAPPQGSLADGSALVVARRGRTFYVIGVSRRGKPGVPRRLRGPGLPTYTLNVVAGRGGDAALTWFDSRDRDDQAPAREVIARKGANGIVRSGTAVGRYGSDYASYDAFNDRGTLLSAYVGAYADTLTVYAAPRGATARPDNSPAHGTYVVPNGLYALGAGRFRLAWSNQFADAPLWESTRNVDGSWTAPVMTIPNVHDRIQLRIAGDRRGGEMARWYPDTNTSTTGPAQVAFRRPGGPFGPSRAYVDTVTDPVLGPTGRAVAALDDPRVPEGLSVRLREPESLGFARRAYALSRQAVARFDHALGVDGSGRAYVAWAEERGKRVAVITATAPRGRGFGAPRILYMTRKLRPSGSILPRRCFTFRLAASPRRGAVLVFRCGERATRVSVFR